MKGSKFLFLFAPENLDGGRRARLRDLLNGDLKVGRAWTLKEQFRHFWQCANARTALSFSSCGMSVQCAASSSQ